MVHARRGFKSRMDRLSIVKQTLRLHGTKKFWVHEDCYVKKKNKKKFKSYESFEIYESLIIYDIYEAFSRFTNLWDSWIFPTDFQIILLISKIHWDSLIWIRIIQH